MMEQVINALKNICCHVITDGMKAYKKTRFQVATLSAAKVVMSRLQQAFRRSN